MAYVLFLAFWLVFGVLYVLRDRRLDSEKTRRCDLW